MAKKVRRVKKKKSKTAAVAQPGADVTLEQDVSKKEKAAAVKEKTSTSFEEEYAYVIKDLKRVLFVSGAMFLLLIVLNLVVQ